ncbi:MAG: hypothetical protein KGY56_11865, partial [Desulfobacterales bacterium]|nr:hypothetical protein [Desulfobacterales bacterium]
FCIIFNLRGWGVVGKTTFSDAETARFVPAFLYIDKMPILNIFLKIVVASCRCCPYCVINKC